MWNDVRRLLSRLPTLASDKTALSRSDQDPECGVCYTNRGLRHKFVSFKVRMGHGLIRTSSEASLHEKKAGWVVARFLATKAMKGVSHINGNLLPHVTRIITPTIILLAISTSSMQTNKRSEEQSGMLGGPTTTNSIHSRLCSHSSDSLLVFQGKLQ